MDLSTFIAALVSLQLACLWAGKKASQELKDQEDYFLAGKSVHFFPLLMTFIATQIGGGLVLGAAEEAYRFGWSVLLYPLGSCLGFVLLSLGVGKKLAQYPVSTVAQLLEHLYASPRLKKMASTLSILSLFMILIAQVIASRKFMASLQVDNSVLFLLFWGVVIVYTVMGGLKAVVSIDIIQALFFITAFALALLYILISEPQEVIQGTLLHHWTGDGFDFNSEKLTGWLLMPLLFMVIEQDMAQRCFAANSPRTVTKASAFAALGTFTIALIPIFFGILGQRAGVLVPNHSSVFMDTVQALTNPYLSAIIACAVLMAILSTAISLLNAVSSNLSQDFDFGQKTKEGSVRFAKQITAWIGFFAVLGSFFAVEIVGLLIQSYELSVYCVFIPVCAALVKRQKNATSAWMAALWGAVAFCGTRFYSFESIPKEFLALLCSFLGFVLGEVYCKLAKKAPAPVAHSLPPSSG